MVAQTLENGFYDDFDGASLDPAFWGSATAGTGAVTVANSVVTVDSPAVGDAAFVYALSPININKSSIFRICVQTVTPADKMPDVIGISRDQSVPATGNEAAMQDVLLGGVSFQTTTPYHALTHYIGDDVIGTYGSEDFLSLNGGESIGLLPNWQVDFGNAVCREDGTYGKTFECFANSSNTSSYVRITDAMGSVDQWMSFQFANYTGIMSVGPAFRLSGASGFRYYVRIRNSDGAIEWARENGNSNFTLIERSGGDFTPNGGDYVGFEVAGTGASTVARFWNFGSTPPSTDGPTAWGPATWTSTQSPGGNAVDTGDFVAMSYYYRDPRGQYVDNVVWGPYPLIPGPSFKRKNLNVDKPPRAGATADCYVLTLEIDGANKKIRGSINHAVTVGWNEKDQGLALSYLGEWQDIPASFTGPNMYAYFGKRYTDIYSGNWNVEWAYLEEIDTILDGWSNVKADGTPGGFYDLYKNIGYGTHWMPTAPGAAAIAIPKSAGTPGYDQGNRGKFIGLEDGTYYMFLESASTTNFGDAVIDIFTAPSPNGPWTYQSNIDPTIIGPSYVSMGHAWILRVDDTPTYNMLIMATQATYAPRIFMLTSNNLTSGWSKFNGAGTDGCVIDLTGANNDWRRDGVGEITIVWDDAAGNHKAMVSGYNNESGYNSRGWTVGLMESNDFGQTWTEVGSNPIIPVEDVRSDVLNASENTILVADGSQWTVGSAVAIMDQPNGFTVNYNRIRAISGNTLILDHQLSGVTTSHDIAQVGSGSIAAMYLYWETKKSRWVLIATVFQPFRRAPTGFFGASEMSGRFTAPDLTGPWTQDRLHTLNLAPGNSTSGADVSNENLRGVVVLSQADSGAVAPGIILGM